MRNDTGRAARAVMVAAAAALTLGAATVVPEQAVATPDTLAGTRPNIVLVLADDLTVEGAAHMPYLQSLIGGKQVVNYTRAEVNNSLCCPSRASILAGQVDTRTGVLHNALGQALDPTTTGAVALDNAGYQTGFFGKMFNGFDETWVPQSQAGWDDFQPISGGDAYAQ